MSNLQSLSEVFQNKLFRIPDYQRGYAWKRSQLIDFWEDIMNLREGRFHYTGMLSLKAVPRKETQNWGNDTWLLDTGYKAYHIVDGQQRITTFSILINEMVSFVKRHACNIGKNEEDIVICYQTLQSIRTKYISKKRPPQNLITTYLFGYETDNPSAEYLIHRVFDEPYSGTINETYYTQNLKYAKDFFSACLQKLYEEDGVEGIETLFRKLTQQLMFNIHEIEEDYDVFIAFETMNNRGKKLTNLELLKNRLIYLTTLYDEDQLDGMDKTALRNRINDTWKEVYYQLGRNQKSPLSDDEFLRAHWILYFKYTRKKGDDYINFLLNYFSSKKIFEKYEVAVEDEVPDSTGPEVMKEDEENLLPAEEETKAEHNKLRPEDITEYVNSLKHTAENWFYSYFPQYGEFSGEEKIWLERLNRIGIGYFRPLVTVALSLQTKVAESERIDLYKTIERFIFVMFRMGVFQSSFKSSDYYRKARSLYRGELSIEEVTQSLTEITDERMGSAVKNFITRTENRFANGDGFYGWRDIRYVLYEYEYEKARKTGIEKIGWTPFTKVEKDKVSIEHILPQTPADDYWKNQFKSYTAAEIKILSGSLGNLLPLSQSVNSSLQNTSFPNKKSSKTNGRRGYSDGSHSEIEVSLETDWNAEGILARGLKLLNFIETRWNVQFTDEKQKIELLHIPFVRDGRGEVAGVAPAD
ncbi:DUF262 domain-containing protein [Sporosarcina sp. P33]|uniref:DUF262 domain-containing protein n=1 Tax=Sporosarcina sp. P33 TaxID=1930764 RepID=UPI0009BD9B62|nr:DUF262 domain-containing protein [Sporosarcina sp. P33]ARD46959.1 hypothetical protein SporoP33_01015 [Sporosarcina sp. P33]